MSVRSARVAVFAAALSVSALPLTVAAQTDVRAVVDPAVLSLDSMFAATYPADGPGAAVIVARGADVLLRKAYGMADMELGVPLTPDHVFRIASITKQFTAVAILMLADEGRLSLDDEITRFFPDWPTHGHRITVEHLLTHTSGIRSYTSMPGLRTQARSGVALDALIASFRGEPMDFAPGTDYRYNNSGYVLLGAIIEQVSGQAYADFVRARIFEPLGMASTRYEDQSSIVRGRVSGYSLAPQTREVRNAEFLDMSVPHAAGALVSTVDDLLRWQRALAEGRLLRQDTWRRAFTPVALSDGRSSGYAYGWFAGRAAGVPSIEHGGDINGFSAEALWLPDADVSVIVLSNIERSFANPGQLTVQAAERLLGVAGGAPAVAIAPERLDEYVAVYRISDTEERIILREGGTLFSVRGTAPRQQLHPVGGDEFVYVQSGTRAMFERDAAGGVSGMRVIPRIGPEQQRATRTTRSVQEALAALAAPPVSLPAATLERYVGEYELAPEFILTVRRSDDGLVAQATGQGVTTLDARTETRFTIREVAAAIEFQVDEAGAVTGLVLEQGAARINARRLR